MNKETKSFLNRFHFLNSKTGKPWLDLNPDWYKLKYNYVLLDQLF